MRLLGAALMLVACGHASPAPDRAAVEIATPLPALALPLMSGGAWSSQSARGSMLVIDVWASWCKPCGKAFPKLDALAARRSDVAVVAISIDEDPAAIREFVAQFPLAVPIAQDAEQQMTREPLGIAQLPTLLIVDRDQIIRRRIEEPTEKDYNELERLVDSVAAAHSIERPRCATTSVDRMDAR